MGSRQHVLGQNQFASHQSQSLTPPCCLTYLDMAGWLDGFFLWALGHSHEIIVYRIIHTQTYCLHVSHYALGKLSAFAYLRHHHQPRRRSVTQKSLAYWLGFHLAEEAKAWKLAKSQAVRGEPMNRGRETWWYRGVWFIADWDKGGQYGTEVGRKEGSRDRLNERTWHQRALVTRTRKQKHTEFNYKLEIN